MTIRIISQQQDRFSASIYSAMGVAAQATTSGMAAGTLELSMAVLRERPVPVCRWCSCVQTHYRSDKHRPKTTIDHYCSAISLFISLSLFFNCLHIWQDYSDKYILINDTDAITV